MSYDVSEPRFAVGVGIGSILGVIFTIIFLACVTSSCHESKTIDPELSSQVTAASLELEWSSPTQIKQVFWVEDRSYGSYFWCDTDTGDGNSTMYKVAYGRSRAPRVGEWWKLAIDENGNKYLYTPDWDKTKKENGGELP